MKQVLSLLGLAILGFLFMAQGGVIGPKGVIGPNGVLGAAAGGATNTFTLVQGPIYSGTTGPCGNQVTCATTVTALGSGHLLVLQGFTSQGSAIYISSVACTSSSCGTWVVPTGAGYQINDASGGAPGALSSAYVLSSSSGATTVTITWNNASPGGGAHATFWEYSYTPGPCALDIGGTVPDAVCSSCPGVALSLTGTQDVILQELASDTASPSAITTYTNFANGSFTGWADLENTSSGTAPTWTETSGHTVGIAIAFK